MLPVPFIEYILAISVVGSVDGFVDFCQIVCPILSNLGDLFVGGQGRRMVTSAERVATVENFTFKFGTPFRVVQLPWALFYFHFKTITKLIQTLPGWKKARPSGLLTVNACHLFITTVAGDVRDQF